MFQEMKVAGLAMDPLTNTPIIILKDLDEKKTLPIWIGILEASSIATQLEKIQLPRPMTHDLMKNIFGHLSIRIIKIEVTELKDNTFYALIHLKNGEKTYKIDSRPSDAIAIALRTDAPIYVNQEVIEKSRQITLDKEEPKSQEKKSKEEPKWDEILDKLVPDDFGKTS
ncbi:MAG: bifunctional nuclease family protein [Thermodesulfobacteriota bacterium]|nr:bifunctional nuclease family protein [Thermodesulfobacteriota bacterium]